MTAEPPLWWRSSPSGPLNDMTLSFGSMLMPSVFREYTLGDKGDMIVRGVGEQGVPEGPGMSVR